MKATPTLSKAVGSARGYAYAVRALPAVVGAALVVWLPLHTPIAERPDHNVFADQRVWLGISNAGDVLSNLAFFLVGVYGLVVLRRRLFDAPATAALLASLLVTAIGSAWYHTDPGDSHLLAYRLPNALLAMSLLAAVVGESLGRLRQALLLAVCLLIGLAGTVRSMAAGDLRSFLGT